MDIGKHCELETCRQLDYCPFFCQHCKKNFCLEHRMADTHECPSTKVKPLPVPEHKPTIIKCDICNRVITNHIITPYKCPKCNINTCSTHRYLDAHQCKSLGKVIKDPKNPYVKLSERFVKSKNGSKVNNAKLNKGMDNNTKGKSTSATNNTSNNDIDPDMSEKKTSCIPCNILSNDTPNLLDKESNIK